jgi:lipopolysaccharide export system protein LptA
MKSVVPAFFLVALFASVSLAQGKSGNAVTINADAQEANAKTGIVIATGNVRIQYPARQITATAGQAVYDTKKRTITMIGGVVIVQKGENTIRSEKVTYLIKESIFKAEPQPGKQVTSVYVVPPEENQESSARPGSAPNAP